MAALPMTWEIIGAFGALIGAEIFGSGQEAFDAYNVLNDDKLLTLDDWSIQYTSIDPELTGGAKNGTTVKSITYDEPNNQYIATSVGVPGMTTLKTLGYSLLNALGVNVSGNYAQIDGIIADAFSNIFQKTITAAQLNYYFTTTLIKDGISYISAEIVKRFSDAAYNAGIFSAGGSSYQLPSGAVARDNLIVGSLFTPSDMLDMFETMRSACVASGTITDSAFTVYKNGLIAAITNAYPTFFDANNVLQVFRVVWNTGDRRFLFVARAYTSPIADLLPLTSTWILQSNNTSYCQNFQYSNSRVVGQYNTWTAQGTSFSGSLQAGIPDTSTMDLSSSNIGRVIVPAIDGIDEQIGATTPKDNDIDIGLTYPTWLNSAIPIDWWNDRTKVLDRTTVIPLDIDTDDTVKVRDRTQAKTQDGAITDAIDITTTTTLVNDTLTTLTVPTDGTKVEVSDTVIPINPGVTPTITVGGGSGSGMSTVFNPTETEVQSLKGVLWEQNMLTNLVKIFTNNPMDAIISLHTLYCQPSTSGSAEIKLGNLATGITGVSIVNKQYITIDCGTVSVAETYGNATDYAPFTEVSVYLPFIGIQQLNANDLMGGRVNIQYQVDVYTGACLAEIRVTKNNATQMLYQFSGSCAVEIPLTGSDHSRTLSAMITGAVGGFATGGAGGALLGTVTGAAFSKPAIMRSGSFGSNAGAMGYKKPYLIITRQIPYEANNYSKLYGYPSNRRVTLASQSGYTKVKEVHVDNMACTESEKAEIETLLLQGVVL